ncbi:MAG: triose-phosphate isomerase, partial [Alphaproteobacteria bacterium]
DIGIAPPATLLREAAGAVAGSGVLLGGQDCHGQVSGAHTGDISAEMLKDAGADFVICGHSERRGDHAESDDLIQGKAIAAQAAGLTAVICVGESEAERDAGDEVGVIVRQLADSVPARITPENTVIAYEPVWAIGTGRTASLEAIADMHGNIRAWLQGHVGGDGAGAFRILYGGSVKPGNAGEILALEDVDGALVGGASLKAEDFLAICGACG